MGTWTLSQLLRCGRDAAAFLSRCGTAAATSHAQSVRQQTGDTEAGAVDCTAPRSPGRLFIVEIVLGCMQDFVKVAPILAAPVHSVREKVGQGRLHRFVAVVFFVAL